MTLEHKTPKARKEARNYCRRCLAVMLCCVLAFGLTVRTAPRAKANAAVATAELIGSGGGGFGAAGALASNPVGATICGLLLVAAGVPFTAGYVQNEDSIFYGTALYELGDNCYEDLYSLGGDIGDWLLNETSLYTEKGGVAPGDKIEVPAYIAEAVRQWAGTNLNFADGVCTYDQAAIYTTDGSCFVLSELDTSGITNWYEGKGRILSAPLVSLGTPLQQTAPTWAKAEVGTYDFSYFVGQLTFTQTVRIEEKATNNFSGDYSLRSNFLDGELCDVGAGRLINGTGFSTYPSADELFSRVTDLIANDQRVYFLFYSRANNRIYSATYDPAGNGACDFYANGYVDVSKYPDLMQGVSTTLTKTPALDEAKTQDMTVAVPADIPTTQVGGVSVPVVGALAPEDVLDGTGETDKPRPDVTPWDKILEGLEGIDGKVGSLPQDIADSIAEAQPITGSIAGDQTVTEVMNEPDSLGALAITKFPFSIPWDITKAIKLLAAPPTPPKWEVDLFGPLQGKWGFHSENTSLVIDFERLEPLAVVVRWVSTVMFVYALASATKRFIWTA